MRALLASIVWIAVIAAPHAHVCADEADEADETTALAYLQRGVAAFRGGDFATALEQFEAAHRLAPDKPNPYRWLALTHVQLGDCPSALRRIDGFVSRVPPDEPRVAELIRLRELCQQTGVLKVDSTPARVSLHIDGASVGVTPYQSLSMRAGKHTLTARKPGYAAASQAIVVDPGGQHQIDLRLSRTSPGVTERWWFWPAVAGVVTTAVVIGFVATGDPDATVFDPVQCDDAGCRAMEL